MARNGSGTYSLYTPGNPVVTGTTISSTAFNNTMSDIATALTQSIAADGQTPITANIPMNSKKITGLAAGTTSGDALSYGQAGATVADLTASGNTTVGGNLAVTGTSGFTGAVTIANLTVTGTPAGKFIPAVVYKTATTSRSSTTAYADDPHLLLALTAGTYTIDCFLSFWATTSGGGGIKAKFAYTATITAGTIGVSGNVNAANATGTAGDIPTASPIINSSTISASTGAFDWLRTVGFITVSTSGNLTVQWAQNSSNANAANLAIGSYLTLTKIA